MSITITICEVSFDCVLSIGSNSRVVKVFGTFERPIGNVFFSGNYEIFVIPHFFATWNTYVPPSKQIAHQIWWIVSLSITLQGCKIFSKLLPYLYLCTLEPLWRSLWSFSSSQPPLRAFNLGGHFYVLTKFRFLNLGRISISIVFDYSRDFHFIGVFCASLFACCPLLHLWGVTNSLLKVNKCCFGGVLL